MPYRFEVRDHAADKAATAYGATLNEVFEAAAYAMFDVMFDVGTVGSQESRRVIFEEPYGDQLLKRWLDDLLFMFETERMVFGEFAVEVECPPSPEKTCSRIEAFKEPEGKLWRLRGEARGEPFSQATERRGAVVKAVTYHNLSLRPPEAPGGDWVADMVFDV
jgi:SHS2 domain-containing protein